MAKRSKEEKYTDPELRERIKEEIKTSDRGGKEGQWSARKSQLLTQEYEKRGGGYKGEKDESQKNLEKWTDEEWQTQQGDAQARGDDGETKRYLPKKAWENMSEEEKRKTEEKKREGSRHGRQHVPNTERAKEARKDSQALPIENYDDLSVEQIKKELDGLSNKELERVREYEKANHKRKTLLEALEREL
jgi:Family of unknown function (DUF5872)